MSLLMPEVCENRTFDIAAPSASALVESMRAFGYDLPTAIADLVDNSVAAKARNIWVDFLWDGEDSTISVTDDGEGMDEAALISAMRPGSRSPLAERAPHDLGRFGLGLKTASFSQCRRLTVRSRTTGLGAVTRCWDLDHVAAVNEWQLLRAADAAAEQQFVRLESQPQGTCLVWQRLDRLVRGQRTGSDRDQKRFLQEANAVGIHLGMVFHRLLSGPHPLKVFINDQEVRPWDPYLESEPATQILPVTRLKLRDSFVEVRPFVLPHHSKLSTDKSKRAAGPRGWTAHQGFFVYRQDRLLVAGDWLGLGWTKEDHQKLARIRVDIPTSQDHDWQLDVTKSRIVPPVELRDQLGQIGELAVERATRVFSFRGARLSAPSDAARVLLWSPLVQHGRVLLRINRDHPLVSHALRQSPEASAVRALLRLLEETVPAPRVVQGPNPSETVPGPFEVTSDTQDVMDSVIEALRAAGHSETDARERLRTIWPFELFPALLDNQGGDRNV